MAAGQGFKTFATGDVLSAADVNGYLMQGVLVFADSAERDAEITSPEEGQFAYLKDTNVTTYYTGSAWANLDTTGMTNPMTTTGDVIYSSSGSTPARLGIGTAGQVLQVNSGATAPEWATAGGGGGMTLLSTTNMSGSSTSVTGISGSYNTLLVLVNYGLGTTSGVVSATLNSATSNYLMTFARQDTTTNGGATSNIPINAGVSQQDSGDGSICQSAITVYNYASTATTKAVSFSGNFRTGTSTQGINGGGTYVSTSAITSFQINTSAGTLEGTIRIYGIK